MAAVGIDYVALGKQTGEMAAKVLKGEATAAETPFEICEGGNVYVNTEAAGNIWISQFLIDVLGEAAETLRDHHSRVKTKELERFKHYDTFVSVYWSRE